MLFTAAIMMCIKDLDPSYEKCQILNADFKYRTEEHCYSAINGKLNQMLKFPEITREYEPLYIQCIPWLPLNENTNEI